MALLARLLFGMQFLVHSSMVLSSVALSSVALASDQSPRNPDERPGASKQNEREEDSTPAPANEKGQIEPTTTAAPQDGGLSTGSKLSSGSNSPPEKKPAASAHAAAELDEVDVDFAFQGEYMGRVPAILCNAERAGLQVVARGDGKFECVLLRGGLPGAGWDRRTREKLNGERQQGRVLVKNDRLTVWLDGRRALIHSTPGTAGGIQLEKYHRISATQDAPPPRGAEVLFSGRNTRMFQKARMTESGLLGVGALTKYPVSDFQMHLEFRTPYMPSARGQARGNSGVYIQQRYEVQILDSFGLDGIENECGAMYRQRRPEVNMCLPPLSWQTYDIFFTAARWSDDGKKQASARISVLHNGEPIHVNYELVDKTGGGKQEGPEDFPILLQDHRNPVSFRNIWLISTGAGMRRFVGTSALVPCQLPYPDLWNRSHAAN